jgi:indolepyruvate decarboxylase
VAFTVADYIVRRLAEQHVDILFGVPGAYCSPLFDVAIRQGMRTVVTASDLEAGYAADGYARIKGGLGATAVAYGVGALSNAIAGAFVERSPMVVVDGGPTPGALSNLHQFDVVPSHSIGQHATDLSAYKLVTGTESALAATIVGMIRAAQSPEILCRRQGVQRTGADRSAGGRARPAGRADGRGLGRRRPAAMKSGVIRSVMR